MERTATFIKDLPREDWKGEAKLYKSNEEILFRGYANNPRYTNYLIVSACNAFDTGEETYIFPSDEGGNVLDWLELGGSTKGIWDHELALRNGGYTVI